MGEALKGPGRRPRDESRASFLKKVLPALATGFLIVGLLRPGIGIAQQATTPTQSTGTTIPSAQTQTRQPLIAGYSDVVANINNLLNADQSQINETLGQQIHVYVGFLGRQGATKIYELLRNGNTQELQAIASQLGLNSIMATAVYTNEGPNGKLWLFISSVTGEGRNMSFADFGGIDIGDPAKVFGQDIADRMKRQFSANRSMPSVTGIGESIVYFAKEDSAWGAQANGIQRRYWLNATFSERQKFLQLAQDPPHTSTNMDMQYSLPIDLRLWEALANRDGRVGELDATGVYHQSGTSGIASGFTVGGGMVGERPGNEAVWLRGLTRYMPLENLSEQDTRELGPDIVSALRRLLAGDSSRLSSR